VSTIKVDTVQSRGGGAVTLTNQAATKLHVRYTTVTTTATVGSPLNVSTLTDNGTADTSISISSNVALIGDLA
jgi:hypothetical protein